jgi:hypothetical protein
LQVAAKYSDVTTNRFDMKEPRTMFRRKPPQRALLAVAAAIALSITSIGSTVRAQERAAITADARKAIETMGRTLSGPGFSMHERAIREYTDADGQPLHIFHSTNVLARRPDRMLADAVGDDGETKMLYDGKDLTLYSAETNKYATLPAQSTIEATLREAARKMGVDFPLADLLADAPAKAFLSGITSGYVVNTVKVDGVPCQHLLFTQPPGIEIELWLEKNDRALPRRLIVTYRSLPGEPRFIAEMSDWNLDVRPTDSAFSFTMPNGATKVRMEQEAPK